MTQQPPATSAAGYRELTITRVFDAPAAVLFRAWTEPEQFARWWGSNGMTTPVETTRLDVRPGGEWYACMQADADPSVTVPFSGIYEEIVPNQRLVMTLTDGPRPDPDRRHILTVTFTESDGRTEMVMRQAGDFSDMNDEQLVALRSGWGEFLGRLASVVEGQPAG
jgi:uncharacterized protein YndB with AHSA1/START domain